MFIIRYLLLRQNEIKKSKLKYDLFSIKIAFGYESVIIIFFILIDI